MVARRVAAQIFALDDGDPELGAALKTAVDAVLADRPSPNRKRDAGLTRGRQTAPVARLLVSPSTRQSNVEVNQGDAAQTIVATNHARRYCHVLVYEVASAGSDGVRVDYPKAKQVGGSLPLKSTAALGVASTLFGFYSGQTAFVPVSTPPIPLTMATGKTRTFFDVIVLGSSSVLTEPGFFAEPRYADAASSWRDLRLHLNFRSWLLDVLLGLVLEFCGLRDLAVAEGAVDGVIASLKALQIQSWLEVVNAVESGRFDLATRLFMKLCASDRSFVVVLRSILARLSPTLMAALSDEAGAASSKLAMAAFSNAFAVVGVLLGAGDLAAVLWDLAHAEQADRWQATLALTQLTLSPAVSEIAPGASQVLTASVPTGAGSDLLYAWSLTGSDLASLREDTESKVGRSFETHGRVVTLATTPSTQGELTVSVKAYQLGEGGARTLLDETSARVRIVGSVLPGTLTFEGFTYQDYRDANIAYGGAPGSGVVTAYHVFDVQPGAQRYKIRDFAGVVFQLTPAAIDAAVTPPATSPFPATAAIAHQVLSAPYIVGPEPRFFRRGNKVFFLLNQRAFPFLPSVTLPLVTTIEATRQWLLDFANVDDLSARTTILWE